jgi:hypothetical protein
MSTINVSNLKNASAANPAFVLAADGSATANLSSVNGGPIAGSRNRIINGDMRIDQRNAGASVTPTDGQYTIDRWVNYNSAASKLTAQRNAGSVTPPSGFTNYMGITSSSAYSSLAADYFGLVQFIEGFNTADLDWGTANAKTVALSFWARSSLTGTFGGFIRNSAGNRNYLFSYSISAANTWEYKTISITGDTTGTWLTDNGIGLRLWFDLGSGSTATGTPGSWGTSSLARPTGAVSVVGTNGATFYITGVQLEPGTVATPFERRSYGQELALCQRYYLRDTYTVASSVEHIFLTGLMYSTAQFEGVYFFPVEMRSAPTLGSSSVSTFKLRNASTAITSLSIYGVNTRSGMIYTSNSATGSVAQANSLTSVSSPNGTVAFLDFNSEL